MGRRFPPRSKAEAKSGNASLLNHLIEYLFNPGGIILGLTVKCRGLVRAAQPIRSLAAAADQSGATPRRRIYRLSRFFWRERARVCATQMDLTLWRRDQLYRRFYQVNTDPVNSLEIINTTKQQPKPSLKWQAPCFLWLKWLKNSQQCMLISCTVASGASSGVLGQPRPTARPSTLAEWATALISCRVLWPSHQVRTDKYNTWLSS